LIDGEGVVGYSNDHFMANLMPSECSSEEILKNQPIDSVNSSLSEYIERYYKDRLFQGSTTLEVKTYS